MDSIKDQLDQAMAQLEETRRAVDSAKERLSQASATVRSHDRSVEVTVSSQGQLTAVKFLDGKYRTMGAAQLSASVMEATRQAQAQMAQEVMDAFRPLTDQMGDGPQPANAGVDWDEVFGPLMRSVERSSERRAGASDKLRDEIHEDGEGR